MKAYGPDDDHSAAGANQAPRTAAGRAFETARRWSLRLSRWLALVVVALAPLPFGSVEPAWVALWCAVMATSLLLAGIPALPTTQMRIMFVSSGIYACMLLVILLQSFDVSPDPMWREARMLLGDGFASTSAAPRPTSPAVIGNSLLFVLVFCRLFLLGADGGGKQIFRVIAWSGLGYALYGVLAFALDPGDILWRTKTAYLGNLTGTFVNRNTAATYFGSVTVLWAILLLSAMKRDHARSLSASERLWLALGGRQAGMIGLVFGTLLCLGATAATGSRAGFVLTLAAFGLTVALYGGIGWTGLRRRFWLAAGVCFAAILVLEMLAGRVTTRFQLIGFDDEARLDVYRASLGLVGLRPWLGWGLGSFEAVFAPVRPQSVGMIAVWDRAHSTPLELAVELGAPLALLLGCVWLWFFGRLVFGSLRSRSPIVVAGCAVGFLGTLHSSIDFSLQIPGFAVIFAALTAAGLAQATAAPGAQPAYISLRGKGRKPRGKQRMPSRPGI